MIQTPQLFLKRIVSFGLLATLLGTSLPAPLLASVGVPATFTPNELIADSSFIAINTMSVADIQSFLAGQNSVLTNFSENGQTAAQIIWGAAHGAGNASGNCSGSTVCFGIDINTTTGTVSPKVLLVTLQKEQSLITSTTASQGIFDAAMGYACPDGGGCNPSYKGFTKQVENAAWQLRFNYERALVTSFTDYKVGQTMTFYDGSDTGKTNPRQVTFGNAATAGLYRYTPHVYNGNYNFWNRYRQWFGTYQAKVLSQTSSVTLANTESALFSVSVQNTGETTWQREQVNLGTDGPRDRVPQFAREDQVNGNSSGWLKENRIKMVESSVAPGGTGTFAFYYTVPAGLAAGTYTEKFNLVTEGVGWFDDLQVSWNITVVPLKDSFKLALLSRSPNQRLTAGQSGIFEIQVQNTGYFTWKPNVVALGTDQLQDRIPRFIREDRVFGNPSGWRQANRVSLVESSVPPGSLGTFRFAYTVPDQLPAGLYREHFRPVADNIAWLENFDLSWDITVIPFEEAMLSTQWVGQSNHLTLKRNQSNLFTVQIKNSGLSTWQQGVINLGTDRHRDRIPRFIREDRVGNNPSGWLKENRVKLTQESVAPGQVGTFQFYYTVPPDMPLGNYREYFRLVNDNLGWMQDWGIYWDITVTE